MMTLPSFYDVFGPTGQESDSELVGAVAAVISDTPSGSTRSVASVYRLLHSALAHDRLHVLFDEEGAPAAYIIWANVSPLVEQRIIQTRSSSLHFTEWNEGSSIWIIDFGAKKGRLPYAIRYLRDVLFVRAARVCYLTSYRKTLRAIEVRRSLFTGILRTMEVRQGICRCNDPSCEFSKDIKVAHNRELLV